MPVSTTTLTPNIGVEVTDLTGAELVDPQVAEEMLALLAAHGVVVCREVHVSDADLVAFSRFLGDVSPNPTAEHELPEIATITLDPTKTRELLAWYREGNFIWHIDGATEELPQRATLLSAREVDDSGGGDTEFASTYAAYDASSLSHLPRMKPANAPDESIEVSPFMVHSSVQRRSAIRHSPSRFSSRSR